MERRSRTPNLVGNSEARAVLDEVRAARRLPARAFPDRRLRVIARRSGDRPSVGLGSLTDEGELVDRSLPLPSAGPSFSTLTEDRRRDDSTLNLSGPTVHEELDAGHEARVARREKERRVGDVIRIANASERDVVPDVSIACPFYRRRLRRICGCICQVEGGADDLTLRESTSLR